MGAWGRRRQPVIRAAIKRPKNMAAQFYSHHGILTEGEGSVQLTSSLGKVVL
jgi:hypothetical protein